MADWIAPTFAGQYGRLTGVWQMAEFPAAELGISTWVTMFRYAGFVCDEEDVDDEEGGKPNQPLRAYRGSSWGRRRGMSWSTDPTRAEWFAARWGLMGSEAAVFSVLVPPEAVLALVGIEGRNEDEVVVDPQLLPPIRRSSVWSPSGG